MNHSSTPKRRKGKQTHLFLLLSLMLCLAFHSEKTIAVAAAFSSNSNNNPPSKASSSSSLLDDISSLSRRDAILLGIGALSYGKLVGDALSRLSRGNVYPPEHEDRVKLTFRNTLVEAAKAKSKRGGGEDRSNGPLRVLEVGIGSECRTITRGLYNDAIVDLSKLSGSSGGLELVGIDLVSPKSTAVEKARESLSSAAATAATTTTPSSLFETSFEYIAAPDISSSKLPFPDGYFDAVTCCLTLCSVSDQMFALNEMNRVLNSDGGTFGYVEHVAVRVDDEDDDDLSLYSNDEEQAKNNNRFRRQKYEFLEWQQQTLDPLQQIVADNCHLHRNTDLAVWDVFGANDSKKSADILEKERFFVDDMWPVFCQCRGVIQKSI